ncbi:MAG: YheU family protein [Polyangiaceae bacterium]
MSEEDDAIDEQTPGAHPVEIPFVSLSPAALAGVIEAFVLREGTDYGARETELAAKAAQVRGQLERGEATIVFDPSTQSVTLLTREELRRILAAAK